MNIRRGLFRFWMIFSALFITATFVFSFDSLHKEFENKYGHPWTKVSILLIPVDCKEAIGKEGIDYNKIEKPWDMPWGNTQIEKGAVVGSNLCWYELPVFRKFLSNPFFEYSKYKDFDDEALEEKLYEKAGIEIKHPAPWKLLFQTLIFAIGIPLVILALGRSLLWAIAGFRK